MFFVFLFFLLRTFAQTALNVSYETSAEVNRWKWQEQRDA